MVLLTSVMLLTVYLCLHGSHLHTADLLLHHHHRQLGHGLEDVSQADSQQDMDTSENAEVNHSETVDTNTHSDPVHTHRPVSDISQTSSNSSSQLFLPVKQHVVFLKVHKAASSTMQNILMRYAMTHRLNVLMRRDSLHINHTGYHINRTDLVPLPAGHAKYDILCHHLFFDVDEISPFFPLDTVYVGIVRQPFSQFLSSFVYYSQWGHKYILSAVNASRNDPIAGFLRNSSFHLGAKRPNQNMINNRMSVDFGIPLDDFEASKSNQTRISDFIRQLNSTFDLVMIAEMFDESLVMLRRLLGWQTCDVIYMSTNVFRPHKATPFWVLDALGKKFPDDVMRRFEKWAAYDVALYDNFLNIFKEKLRRQTYDFHAEVGIFKTLRRDLAKFCLAAKIDKPVDGESEAVVVHTFNATEYTGEVKVTARDCRLMQAKEGDLFVEAKELQKKRLV